MKASEIRQLFIDFFVARGHTVVPSAPVVSWDDPTLLFTNAGMNQFKDVFLGTGTRPYKRAVNSQKCIRVSGKHNDLESVGHDTYHHTFFEMLGNWSFGDYYKEEAIQWAWELVTQVWRIPKSRLWVTVFREDDEAEALWYRVTDIENGRVLRFGEKENFWEMGDTGPCGPCSEIHIDRGEDFCDQTHVPGHVCQVNGGCSRFIELWNLVFIQFNRDENGTLHPLSQKHVDTGLGFERAVAFLQGKKSNYETDLFWPILEKISELTGASIEDPEKLPAFRVIADHIRTLVFAITDGVMPSNEGRGYVLRRLLRRASRYARKLGMHEPFMYQLVLTVMDIMGSAYPELLDRVSHTQWVIQSEEERFNAVLDRGIEIFESIVKEVESQGKKTISGTDAFRLYDTYGFPIDLTQLMARERGLEVDFIEFEKEMETQRERARESQTFSFQSGTWDILTEGEHSQFVGYDALFCEAVIRQVRKEKAFIFLVLNQTPFYPESGGQVGDKGELVGEGFRIRIEDTQKQGDTIIHQGVFLEGNEILSPGVQAKVDETLRLSTARNHTATHLLHKALREVLGNHVQQAGSLVAPDRLRFDFTHGESLTPEQIDKIERVVNEHIRCNHSVEKFWTTQKEAKAMGAVALFGEKYGEKVRVIKINAYSMELCGGTHLDATGQIGYFRIVREEGISAGVRRIEAVTGLSAEVLLQTEKQWIRELTALLQCSGEELVTRVKKLQEENKNLEKWLKKALAGSHASQMDAWIANAVSIGGTKIVSARVEASDVEELRVLGDRLREKLKSGVGVMGTVIDGKVSIVAVVTDDLIKDRGLKAGEIVKKVASFLGGTGGGKPHLALAGGKDPSRLDVALGKVVEVVKGWIHP